MGYNGEIEFPGVIYKQSYMLVYIPPRSCSTLYLKVSFIFLGHEKYIKMLESIPYCSWEHLKPFFLQGIIINHFHTIRGKFFSSMKQIKIHFFRYAHGLTDLKIMRNMGKTVPSSNKAFQLCLIFLICDKPALLFNMNKRKQVGIKL